MLEFVGEYVWYVPEKMRANKKTARPGDPKRFEQDKILVRDTGGRLECTLDTEQFYTKDVLILTPKGTTPYSLYYFTGLINSKSMRYFHETSFPTLHVQRSELAQLPIPMLDLSNRSEKQKHDYIVTLVERILKLHKDLQGTNELDAERRAELQEQIARTDEQIDEAVFDLYELTDEERAVVMNSE